MPTLALSIRSIEGKGRGVYTTQDIPSSTLIHISPVILFAVQDSDASSCYHSVLKEYTYNWTNGCQALALGLGSMFNHSWNHNVGFVRDIKLGVLKYYTIRDVTADSELCINYGPNLWFVDVEGNSLKDNNDCSDQCNEELFLMNIELQNSCNIDSLGSYFY